MKPCYSKKGGSFLLLSDGRRALLNTAALCSPRRRPVVLQRLLRYVAGSTPGLSLSGQVGNSQLGRRVGNDSSSAELGGDTDLDKHIDKIIQCIITGYSNLNHQTPCCKWLPLTDHGRAMSHEMPRTLCSVHLCWSSQKCKIGLTWPYTPLKVGWLGLLYIRWIALVPSERIHIRNLGELLEDPSTFFSCQLETCSIIFPNGLWKPLISCAISHTHIWSQSKINHRIRGFSFCTLPATKITLW